MALTLPDICGKLENPNKKSSVRYIEWFNQWLLPQYTHCIGANKEKHIFLSGEDCYALRCSYLHEGGGDIDTQKIRNALAKFHFISRPNGTGSIHMNQFGNMLQLQIDIFCKEIISAVNNWMLSMQNNATVKSGVMDLLIVHDGSNGVSFP